MDKVKVYELAKELNTTSKRLMEKMAEINIIVKNHMSPIGKEELDALYAHIGVIKHDESKKPETEEKNNAAAPVIPKIEPRKGIIKKDIKSAPRIIRKTEIFIDSRNEYKDSRETDRYDMQRGAVRSGVRGDVRNGFKQEVVRKADNNSGLRPGFVRDAGPAYKKDAKPMMKIDTRPGDVKEPVRADRRQEQKQEIKQEAKSAYKQELSHEVRTDGKKEIKLDELFDTKYDTRHDFKQDMVHEDKHETKIPSVKAADIPEQKNGIGRTERHAEKSVAQKDEAAGTGNRPRTAVNPESRPTTQGRVFPRNDRPPFENRRGPSERPQFDNRRGPYERPQSDDRRGGTGDRQQFAGTGRRGPSDRPSTGQYVNRQGTRPGFDRPQGAYRPGAKPIEIPKPELSEAQKEALNSQRAEIRREFQTKDVDKDVKREQRRDVPKGQTTDKGKKFKPQNIILGEKKGVSEVLSEDFILNEFYSETENKKNKKPVKARRDLRNKPEAKFIPPRAVLTSVKIPDGITVKDLAEALKKTSTEVIKKFMGLGLMVTLNQEIDFDTASIISDEFGIKAEKDVIINEEDILFDDTKEDEKNMEPRPPVVVVMGHVDHGKTLLLDAIRQTNVIDSEAGGITQHIGAYTVKINNRNITFLDTPGHEAFTAMRARGAQVTDVAILVVAADDGVMPQTIEAINHAKAANVSIIVAINKIDKPGSDPDKVKQELMQYNLVSEEWGGDVICVPVSAKKRTNIDHLLEMVLLAADMLELKANPKKQAKGTVIEAKLDKDRGSIATLLVQRGTLFVGDSIVTGTTVGRIRAMVDDKGHKIRKAGPSTPVEITGLPEVPEAGEIFYAITDEKVAKQLAEKRKFKQREQQLKSTARVSLDDLFNQIKEGKVKDLNIIVKADVQGSAEAVKQSLEKLSNEEVRVKIIHGGVGAVTESDVALAQVSNAIIIGFNVRKGTNVEEAAENAGVDIRLYRIIYNAIDDIQAAMKGMLDPKFKEAVQGHTEIRQIFKVSGVGSIGGCYVADGKITRNSDIRLVRNGIVIHEGKLASLKRFKDDVKEVAEGYECGLSIEKFNDIKEGDIVESYVMEEIAR